MDQADCQPCPARGTPANVQASGYNSIIPAVVRYRYGHACADWTGVPIKNAITLKIIKPVARITTLLNSYNRFVLLAALLGRRDQPGRAAPDLRRSFSLLPVFFAVSASPLVVCFPAETETRRHVTLSFQGWEG